MLPRCRYGQSLPKQVTGMNWRNRKKEIDATERDQIEFERLREENRVLAERIEFSYLPEFECLLAGFSG